LAALARVGHAIGEPPPSPSRLELGEQDQVIEGQHERPVAHLGERDLGGEEVALPDRAVNLPGADPWKFITEGGRRLSRCSGALRPARGEATQVWLQQDRG
jgi:hypothetical protein